MFDEQQEEKQANSHFSKHRLTKLLAHLDLEYLLMIVAILLENQLNLIPRLNCWVSLHLQYRNAPPTPTDSFYRLCHPAGHALTSL